jgi:hypothetical protein
VGVWEGVLFRTGTRLAMHIRMSSMFAKLKSPKAREKRRRSERAQQLWEAKEVFQRVQFQ